MALLSGMWAYLVGGLAILAAAGGIYIRVRASGAASQRAADVRQTTLDASTRSGIDAQVAGEPRPAVIDDLRDQLNK